MRKNWGGGDGTYGAERIRNLNKDSQTDTKPPDMISGISYFVNSAKLRYISGSRIICTHKNCIA